MLRSTEVSSVIHRPTTFILTTNSMKQGLVASRLDKLVVIEEWILVMVIPSAAWGPAPSRRGQIDLTGVQRKPGYSRRVTISSTCAFWPF